MMVGGAIPLLAKGVIMNVKILTIAMLSLMAVEIISLIILTIIEHMEDSMKYVCTNCTLGFDSDDVEDKKHIDKGQCSNCGWSLHKVEDD